MPYIIVVNKHRVLANKKLLMDYRAPVNPELDAIFRCSNGKHGEPYYVHNPILDNPRFVYDPANPLPCGASVWLEQEQRP